jgi:hypothetical protein
MYVHMPCIQERNGVQEELLWVLQLLGHYFCYQYTRFIRTAYFVHVGGKSEHLLWCII